MTVYRIVSGQILSEGEYLQRANDISRFFLALTKGQAKKPLALSYGRSLLATAPPAAPPVGFTPVGKNLPLTVMIRDIYTGQYPKPSFFKSDGDVAVVSGLKNYDVFDATARAVNFVKTGASAKSHLTGSAFNPGSALIAYSPAITTDSLTMSIELAVATFPKELLDYLATAFQSLAGVPVLLPYAGYLLGAGSVIKLATGLGDALFGHEAVSFNDTLNFDVPGSVPPAADFRILCNPPLRPQDYTYKDGVGLIDKNGKAYAGDEPYVVVSLDGKDRPNLKHFSPTVASAAILQKFFQMKDGAEATVDTLLKGIKLASDMKYREEAVQLKQQIAVMPAGAAKKAEQDRYNALVKNILDPALVP